MATPLVFKFGGGQAQGTAEMKDLLGSKGAGLAGMARLGLPVPPGFTITTEAAQLLCRGQKKREIEHAVKDGIAHIEAVLNRRFGDPGCPLLVSVRSGAAVSMPGMMDTVLNIGLNADSVEALARDSGNDRFAWDSYRRLLEMYGEIVLGLEHESPHGQSPFALLWERQKKKRKVQSDISLSVSDLRQVVAAYEKEILAPAQKQVPSDPLEQLSGTIMAVCRSWDNPRARTYRQMHHIPESLGTAINVQAMVFGNMGEDCCTGVMFTRNPASGERVLFGEYLVNAQGEDVVAGVRTPKPINELLQDMPQAYRTLQKISVKLEKRYRDMQDIEFTVEKGQVWMLQTRAAKRTGLASLKVAVDMVEEKLITKSEALLRLEPEQLNHLLRPVFDLKAKEAAIGQGGLLARGLPAGPGAASGQVVFSPEKAEAAAAAGQKVILVRRETSPEDIRGMNAAEGILTACGGMTSHAALVSRQMGKICVCGCGDLCIDYGRASMQAGKVTVKEGDFISLDGSTGEVILGEIKTSQSDVLTSLLSPRKSRQPSEPFRLYTRILNWADEVRHMQVRANADQKDQAEVAVALGAEGIGLCRTEHMFFGGRKIEYMREMILANDLKTREKALAKLLPIQRKDFVDLFRVMDGKPVTIRTLDPPLHEFLPQQDVEIRQLAKNLGISPARVRARIAGLKEMNPMLGHRGCRLGIVYSEITRMQARAIAEAVCLVKKQGIRVLPEIMIPLVAYKNELQAQADLVRAEFQLVMKQKNLTFDYLIGTMIELPRAALIADKLAETAEFFSFGTNDLTQTTLGISRDDAGRFLTDYLDRDIIDIDPFVSIDEEGVGQLMQIGVKSASLTRPGIKLGICGEQGGDPRSIAFCSTLGLDYVSSSPFRIPIARLAAAQAALRY